MAFIGNTNTTQAFTPAIDTFSGNGSTVAFTLSRPVASVAQVQVVIANVPQDPNSAYTVSSNTITFTSAPLSGTNNIYVYYTSPITQVITPGQGTVTSDSFGTITNFTTTGNTTLGDATTDTLTVGVTGIVKDASGNVGIGTASPSSVLNVKSSAPIFRLETTGTISSGGTAYNAIRDSTGSDVFISGYAGLANCYQFGTIPAAGFMRFLTGAQVEAMRIDSSGNLLVGTTTSDARIRVSGGGTVGRFVADGGSYTGNIISADTSGTAAGTGFNLILLQAGGANQFRVLGNGNAQNTNNSYGAISDVKLKENIVDTTPKLADLMQVKVRNYNLIGDTTKQIGVVAQELETVFPAMIDETTDKDAEGNDLGTTTKSVKYSVFVPMLLKAIQEQQALILSLTDRITALENR